ncbi:MAG: hypothetical protein E7392_00415 [Ruminococcaceae bacterium]|nr:hypothetical protein [Oscillospiraceae bacterium]
MRILKKMSPIIIPVLIIVLIYSFFHISGWEIRNAKRLSSAKDVTVIVRNEESNESTEYDLNTKQIKLLQKLLEENSYTRRITSTIIGVLPDKRYTIFANWNDNGQKHLHISIIGGEYIQFLGQFGSNYHKIKNPDFEKELIFILQTEK